MEQPEDDIDLYDEARGLERATRRTQAHQIGHLAETRAHLFDKGSFAHATLIQSSICEDALDLGQMAMVDGGDAARAMAEFMLPLQLPAMPRFAELVALVDEGIAGRIRWNGSRLSLHNQAAPLLCYLLAGRDAEVVIQYRHADRIDYFDPVDATISGAVFCRHLVLAVSGRFDEIAASDYDRAKDLKRLSVFFGYHTLLLALARNDAPAFDAALADCAVAFKKRRIARRLGSSWGYGRANDRCFDVIGTVLCRLALERGMRFRTPPARYYPAFFWATPAARSAV